MRKIILSMQMSLDGIVSDVDQWLSMSDEILEDSLDFYDSLDAMIIGGNTYPSLAEYWQTAEEKSESAVERRFAKKINDLNKIILSRSEVNPVWRNSSQLPYKDDTSIVHEIEKLKKSEGKNISVESGVGAWQAFIQHNLFDEIWMFINPVVVGRGTKLFENVDSKFSMKLNNSKRYENGVVGLHYQKE